MVLLHSGLNHRKRGRIVVGCGQSPGGHANGLDVSLPRIMNICHLVHRTADLSMCRKLSRWLFLTVVLTSSLAGRLSAQSVANSEPVGLRPNIVLAIADDWGWPHAGAYGDPAVQTPAFDSVAARGVLFQHAFVSSPSCTPSRGAIITGQHFWRLGGAANLWSEWPHQMFPEYPARLAEAGYFTGHYRKAWGPGKCEQQPAGTRYKTVDAFFQARPADQPFCLWFGSSDPHRGYEFGSGADAGIPLDRVHLFPHFPDTLVVRNDVADYYFEVQRFDRELGELLGRLKDSGEYDNTIVVVTGDHGMPFPRCKTSLYDSGVRVPLAVQGPQIPAERVIDDFVSLTDLAPTFLEAAGVEVPARMTGRSLLPLLHSTRSGQIDQARNHVLAGRERHTVGQERGNRGGYPMRAIRTTEFLFIRNYRPEHWPAGTPEYENAEFKQAWLSDCDNGPTKNEIWKIRETDAGRRLYDLSFGKRPAEELYDLSSDPDQLDNVAGLAEYRKIKTRLAEQLQSSLVLTGDPRAIGIGDQMDEVQPYLGGGGGQWPEDDSEIR